MPKPWSISACEGQLGEEKLANRSETQEKQCYTQGQAKKVFQKEGVIVLNAFGKAVPSGRWMPLVCS